MVVSDFVYDVSSGTINQVVPPAPLRASAQPSSFGGRLAQTGEGVTAHEEGQGHA